MPTIGQPGKNRQSSRNTLSSKIESGENKQSVQTDN